MKTIKCMMMLFLSSFSSQALIINTLNQGYRFDASVYGSIETAGKNIYAQTDLSISFSPVKYGMISFETTIKYRNYSLITTEYLSAMAGGMLNRNELRLGITGGCRTFMFSGFGNVIPLAGGEVLYARYVTERISFRLKERITVLLSLNKTLSTDLFAGFGFSF